MREALKEFLRLLFEGSDISCGHRTSGICGGCLDDVLDRLNLLSSKEI